VPNTYFRLAAWKRDTPVPVGTITARQAASPYVTMYQSRRSWLVWKIFGRRLDGWSDDDFPSLTRVGDLKSLVGPGGRPIEKLDYNDETALSDFVRLHSIDRDFSGSIMPPIEAVKAGRVRPLSDEDRRTIIRWIDLGCPIDLDPHYDPTVPGSRSYGWMCDDQRPTLTMTWPQAGHNDSLARILIGMADAYTGLDPASLVVVADFAIDSGRPGQNLAPWFTALPGNRWELNLAQPIESLPRGTIIVFVKDRQGNLQRVHRELSVGNH
jgi:hypothetical protein